MAGDPARETGFVKNKTQPNKRLEGYLRLTGQLTGPMARQLPLILAQENAWCVQVSFIPSQRFSETVLVYEKPDINLVKWMFGKEEARAWYLELSQLARHWPANCFPSRFGQDQLHRLHASSAVLTFYADGRLRMNFWLGEYWSLWQTEGEWRRSCRRKVKIDLPRDAYVQYGS